MDGGGKEGEKERKSRQGGKNGQGKEGRKEEGGKEGRKERSREEWEGRNAIIIPYLTNTSGITFVKNNREILLDHKTI